MNRKNKIKNNKTSIINNIKLLIPEKTLALFPPPYGYFDPNPTSGDYCSSVFIYTGWENISLRIDLRFYISNFSSTDWLLSKGLRIRMVDD